MTHQLFLSHFAFSWKNLRFWAINHSHIVLIIGDLNGLGHLPEFADQIWLQVCHDFNCGTICAHIARFVLFCSAFNPLPFKIHVKFVNWSYSVFKTGILKKKSCLSWNLLCMLAMSCPSFMSHKSGKIPIFGTVLAKVLLLDVWLMFYFAYWKSPFWGSSLVNDVIVMSYVGCLYLLWYVWKKETYIYTFVPIKRIWRFSFQVHRGW